MISLKSKSATGFTLTQDAIPTATESYKVKVTARLANGSTLDPVEFNIISEYIPTDTVTISGDTSITDYNQHTYNLIFSRADGKTPNVGISDYDITPIDNVKFTKSGNTFFAKVDKGATVHTTTTLTITAYLADGTTITGTLALAINVDALRSFSIEGPDEIEEPGNTDYTFSYDPDDEYVVSMLVVVTEKPKPVYKDMVNLGLPSGLLWAKCNLGAENPQDAGLYFAWGETEGYENGSGHVFNSNNYKASGISTNLTLAQDAVNVALGGSFRMPTMENFVELCQNTFAEWTDDYNGTGVAGMIFYSCAENALCKGRYKMQNGSWKAISGTSYSNSSTPDGFVAGSTYNLSTLHVFFPAAGRFSDSSLLNGGTVGYYLSSSWYTASVAYSSLFGGTSINPQNDYYRYYGMPVRAVK